MAVAGADLIAPRGVVTAEVLTGLRSSLVATGQLPATSTATDVADAYAAAGVAHVALRSPAWTDDGRRERAAVAWAQARALRDRATAILASAQSATAAGEGGVTYSVAQAQALNAAADAQHDAYLGEVYAEDAAVAAVDPIPPPPTSRSARAVFTW